ncbi:MAG: heavy metal-responsive transcriptional regulator [Betaproteobacteria bacterium]|nr:heavy metal-responsive transcriptional regulator [Betaproteobacteria bacterium]MDH3435911.1 heavy metal-responsive transcriptional regulator [Betaproteobacteria bacterium]
MNELTIGRVARRAGLAIDTVRYYEREGLLDKPVRTSSGYRQYSANVVVRLGFIRQAKELGFTLSEIRELLALKVAPGKSCADVRARAEAKIADIAQRIAQLNRMKRALAKLATACSGRGPTSECPILDAMEARKLAS